MIVISLKVIFRWLPWGLLDGNCRFHVHTFRMIWIEARHFSIFPVQVMQKMSFSQHFVFNSEKCWYVGLVFLAWISAWQTGGRLKNFSGKVPWTHGCCSRWVAHKTCDARHVWRIGIHDAIPKKCNEISPVMGSSWSWSLWKKMVLPVLSPFVVVSLESRVIYRSCPLPLQSFKFMYGFPHLARMKMMKVASVFSAWLLASC